ncbi:MAG: ABC transporter ATP-binding protein [Thermodesulfobacteriota bacterium]
MRKRHSLTSLIFQYKRPIVIGLAALSIVDACQLIIPLVIERVVDALTLNDGGARSITTYAMFLVGLGVIMSVFRFVWRYFLLGASRRVEQRLRNQFFNHLELLSLKFFSGRKVGDLMAHTVNDIETVRMACGLGLVIAYDGVVLLVFILAAMLYISPSLTMYAVLPFPILGLLIYSFGATIERRFSRVQEAFSELTESARESLSGIKVIKAHVGEKRELKQFEDASSQYVHKNFRLIKVMGIFQPLIALISGIALGIFLLIGGRGAIYMDITLGDFAAIILYLGMLAWPMIALGWAVDLVRRGRASLKRINEILAIRPDDVDDKHSVAAPIEGDIQLRGLSYTYPDGTRALEDITFDIKSGEALGITGATAAGKTTILELLSRVIEPEEGHIFVNSGTDIKNLRRDCLRTDVVYVPQEATVFSGTIRDNIAFMNAELTDEQIEEAAKLAQIYDEIMGFPDGFGSVVGERGLTISGGQRQRLALARAILLNPKVLVLDDVLSSLDLQTESAVLRNIRAAMKGKTLVAVSSRVPSISGFDRIAVIESGRVRELGTHEELMDRDGIYAGLYNVQTIT